MKKRSIVVLTLSLAAVAASPALAADPLLTPSITPFTPAPKPMLEVEGVAYYGTLRVPPAYIGNSPGVFMFFKSMDRMFYDIGEKQKALREEQNFHIETVNELGGAVVPRIKATTQAQLDALGPAVALNAIRGYGDTGLRVQQALMAEARAWKLLDAAIKACDVDSLIIVEKDLVTDQAAKQKEKDAILQKAKDAAKNAGLFGKAVGFVKDTKLDPSKVKDKLMDMAYDKTVGMVTDMIEEALINNVMLENAETLKAIDARLTAIDKALNAKDGVRNTIDQKRLSGKRDDLAAARIAVMEAGIQRTLAVFEAVDKIDDLAAMERGAKPKGSKLDVFEGLQRYYEEMRMSDRRMRKAANAYLEALDSGAPGQSPRVAKGIRKDITEVRSRPDGDPSRSPDAQTMKWLRLANSTGDYMDNQVRWYREERQRVQNVLMSLETGKHLDFVQTTMATMALKAGVTR